MPEEKKKVTKTDHEARKTMVDIAKTWVGKRMYDGSHKVIVNTYNSHTPLPRGYKVTYNDAWCATFVSAVAIKAGYAKYVPLDCSCSNMIAKFQKQGTWVEKDDYVPKPGDVIFYDWDDSGYGDNVGAADHVGLVASVKDKTITVIEGNSYGGAVNVNKFTVNGKYIRGFGVPKYPKTEPTK